jgi:hypothetical protein
MFGFLTSGRMVGDSYIGLIWRSEQLWRHYYREVGFSTAMFSAAEPPRRREYRW